MRRVCHSFVYVYLRSFLSHGDVIGRWSNRIACEAAVKVGWTPYELLAIEGVIGRLRLLLAVISVVFLALPISLQRTLNLYLSLAFAFIKRYPQLIQRLGRSSQYLGESSGWIRYFLLWPHRAVPSWTFYSSTIPWALFSALHHVFFNLNFAIWASVNFSRNLDVNLFFAVFGVGRLKLVIWHRSLILWSFVNLLLFLLAVFPGSDLEGADAFNFIQTFQFRYCHG